MNSNQTLKSRQGLRNTNRPIYGASTVTLNNTIYIYGGFYNVAPWNKEALWTLSNNVENLKQIETDPMASPAVIYHSLQSIDNRTMYSFGGHLSDEDILSPPLANSTELLRYYKFDFDGLKWTPLQKQNGTSPLERFWHTTVQFEQDIYLYGGMNITGGGFRDFWKYRSDIDVWTEFKQEQRSRCGHTSTITNDGRMIVLGGFDCSTSSFLSPKDKSLYPLSNAAIFNTTTSRWYDQLLIGSIPSARTFHTAVKIRDKIVICGGQDARVEPFQSYISGRQMTAILDIETWQWTLASVSAYQPLPTSFSIATLVNETSIAYGFGLNSHSVEDAFYVFDTTANTWVSSATISETTKNIIVPTGAIILLVLLGAISCCLLFIFWVLRKYQATVFFSLKKSIWNPRAGEPLWAEISRLLFGFSFFAIFVLINLVLVIQVQNSPIIDQVHRDKNRVIQAPDIRFCFDGWENQPNPVLHCTTDFGESCDQHLQEITKQVEGSLNYYGYRLNCYLFKGDNELKLGTNRLTSNGTSLQFYYYGHPSNQSILHVETYHPLHDPNIPIYNIPGTFDQWYSDYESAKFQSVEQLNLKSKNVFNLDPTKKSQIGYQFERREKIDLTLWNYIGFGTKREMLHQIETTRYQTNSVDAQDGFLGSLLVFPTSYDTVVMREQRAFTVIHGIGIIGGIFGLIIGFQASVFGYRPRSPWGIVHRWTADLMRKSLLDGLRSRFSNDVLIPIVHPVRYPSQQEEGHRMVKLEERLHVFEFLFQAYYIDDEVFRSLGGVEGV